MRETCPVCGAGTLKKEIVAEPFEYKGQRITISDFIKYRCDKCGEAVVDNATLRETGKILKDFQQKVDAAGDLLHRGSVLAAITAEPEYPDKTGHPLTPEASPIPLPQTPDPGGPL